MNFPITYKRGGFKLTTYTVTNWGGNPDNGNSTSSYIANLANGPISFKLGLQSLTAQSNMETEVVAAAISMKESLFYRNVLMELGFHGGVSERSCLHRHHIGEKQDL